VRENPSLLNEAHPFLRHFGAVGERKKRWRKEGNDHWLFSLLHTSKGKEEEEKSTEGKNSSHNYLPQNKVEGKENGGAPLVVVVVRSGGGGEKKKGKEGEEVAGSVIQTPLPTIHVQRKGKEGEGNARLSALLSPNSHRNKKEKRGGKKVGGAKGR